MPRNLTFPVRNGVGGIPQDRGGSTQSQAQLASMQNQIYLQFTCQRLALKKKCLFSPVDLTFTRFKTAIRPLPYCRRVMRLTFLPLVSVGVWADVCSELCIADGPEICKHGSSIQLRDDIEVCHGYFYAGSPDEGLLVYDISTKFPVLPEDVPRLLALKAICSNHNDVIRSLENQLRRLGSSRSLQAGEVDDLIATLRVLQIGPLPSNLMARWEILRGPVLLAISRNVLDNRLKSIPPVLVILRSYMSLAIEETSELAYDVELAGFCVHYEQELVNVMQRVHLATYVETIRQRPTAMDQQSAEELFDILPRFCPGLFRTSATPVVHLFQVLHRLTMIWDLTYRVRRYLLVLPLH